MKTYANISGMGTPININEAAKALGVSVDSLRRWEKQGLITCERTVGGHRRFDLDKLREEIERNGK
jgi:excisionase family DNA binding protein